MKWTHESLRDWHGALIRAVVETGAVSGGDSTVNPRPNKHQGR